jgi:glyoxylase-like metal-dependent hydrolase (beta-lactamase superfamily II)
MERLNENMFLVDTLKYVEKGTIATYIINFEIAAVIDPGTARGVEILLKELEDAPIEISIKYIATTHIHLDHGGGSAGLSNRLGAAILVHPKGAKHLVNPERLWMSSKQVLGDVAEIYGKPEPADEKLIIPVNDTQKFDLGGETLICYHVPGHAPHMVAYYLKKSKILFPSDAVGLYFHGSVYPVTPPPFHMELALQSLKKLMKLQIDAVAFTHFGVADGGEVLQESYNTIVEWVEIAEKVVKRGGDSDELAKIIINQNESLRELERHNPIAFGFFSLTTAGLIDYVRKNFYDSKLSGKGGK